VSLDRRRTPPRVRGGVPELGVGLCEGGAWVRPRCVCSANAATGRRGLSAVQPKTRPAFVVLGLRLGWAGALGRRPNVPKAREAIRPAKGGSRVSPKDLRVEHPRGSFGPSWWERGEESRPGTAQFPRPFPRKSQVVRLRGLWLIGGCRPVESWGLIVGWAWLSGTRLPWRLIEDGNSKLETWWISGSLLASTSSRFLVVVDTRPSLE